MGLVVDPPLYLHIFKSDSEKSEDFRPVKNWILKNKVKLAHGGTQYRCELRKLKSILGVISELQRAGKIFNIDDDKVDDDIEVLKKLEPSMDFDDPHLVSLVRLSGFKIICVNDPRSHRFLRRTDFYGETKKRPSLYTRKQNKKLLIQENIKGVCY